MRTLTPIFTYSFSQTSAGSYKGTSVPSLPHNTGGNVSGLWDVCVRSDTWAGGYACEPGLSFYDLCALQLQDHEAEVTRSLASPGQALQPPWTGLGSAARPFIFMPPRHSIQSVQWRQQHGEIKVESTRGSWEAQVLTSLSSELRASGEVTEGAGCLGRPSLPVSIPCCPHFPLPPMPPLLFLRLLL